MTIIEIRGGPVTRRTLEKKSKHDVISDALMAVEQCARLRVRLERAEGLLRDIASKEGGGFDLDRRVDAFLRGDDHDRPD